MATRRWCARRAKGRGGTGLKILAVTILTSLDRADLDANLIVPGDMAEIVERAPPAPGRRGPMASSPRPHEAAMIRALPEAAGSLIVTPGVRPAGSASGDQKRIATPARRHCRWRRSYRRRPPGLAGRRPRRGRPRDPVRTALSATRAQSVLDCPRAIRGPCHAARRRSAPRPAFPRRPAGDRLSRAHPAHRALHLRAERRGAHAALDLGILLYRHGRRLRRLPGGDRGLPAQLPRLPGQARAGFPLGDRGTSIIAGLSALGVALSARGGRSGLCTLHHGRDDRPLRRHTCPIRHC